MATSNWSIPTGKAITGATYIKDTDNNIAATIEDLVDWCNNANGTYNDWTLTGLRTDFVDKNTAQTITAVKTVDTLGAIDFTGGELRVGGVAVTSTAAELNILDGATITTAEMNILDGVTSTATELNVLDGIPATLTATELGYMDGVTSPVQTQIDGKASLTGATFTGQVKGITPVAAEDLARKDYVDGEISGISLPTTGTWTPAITPISNVTSGSATYSTNNWMKVGNMVTCSFQLTILPTSTGVCLADITLPIATAVGGGGHAIGTCSSTGEGSNNNAWVGYSANANKAQIRFKALSAVSTQFAVIIQYRIV